jgi:hypothetical protein
VKRYQVDRRSVIELNGCTAEENGRNKRRLNRNEVVSIGLALAVVCSLLACQTAPQTPPASPPPTPAYTAFSPQTPSPYTPAQPMRQLVPGLMVRTTYKAESRGRYQVEIWEMLVGAGKKSEAATLPGAAVIEIASGEGTFTIAGNAREVRTGDVFSIDEGQQVVIEGRSQGTGLMIRATVIRGAAR